MASYESRDFYILQIYPKYQILCLNLLGLVAPEIKDQYGREKKNPSPYLTQGLLACRVYVATKKLVHVDTDSSMCISCLCHLIFNSTTNLFNRVTTMATDGNICNRSRRRLVQQFDHHTCCVYYGT